MHAVLTFPEAMTVAQATGAKIAREGWNGAGQFVRQASGADVSLSDKKTQETVQIGPFMVLLNAQGEYAPWVPSQGDMAACDWAELP